MELDWRRRWRRPRGSGSTWGSLEKILMEEERWLGGNMIREEKKMS